MYSTHRITLPKVTSIPSHFSLPRVPSILEYLVYPVSLPSQSTHIVQPTQSVHLVYPVGIPSQFSLPSIVTLPSQSSLPKVLSLPIHFTLPSQYTQYTHSTYRVYPLYLTHTILIPFYPTLIQKWIFTIRSISISDGPSYYYKKIKKLIRSIHQAKSQLLVGQSQLECLQSLGNNKSSANDLKNLQLKSNNINCLPIKENFIVFLHSM